MAPRSNCSSRAWRTAALVAGLVSCTDDPATFPVRLHAKLQSGDAVGVERLLTPASRPLWRALRTARGDAGVGLGLTASPPELLGVAPQGSRLVLSVRSAGVERDWVLVSDGGRYRLDLNETSIRRPWNLP